MGPNFSVPPKLEAKPAFSSIIAPLENLPVESGPESPTTQPS